MLTVILLLACAHHPDAGGRRELKQADLPPEVAAELRKQAGGERLSCGWYASTADALYNAGRTDQANAIWQSGYTACGPGFGFLAHEALVAAKLEHYDDAAHLVMQELREPGATPLALKLLIALKPKLAPEVASAMVAMGRSAEAPIVAPDLTGEYAWMRQLLCGTQEQALRQSRVQGPDRMLDRLDFACPGGLPQTLYFDYNAAQ